jgi:UDP:flavonoid glycosyltransferase YjiC (YdhE family)
MTILFTSTRYIGHVYPTLPLARALRAAGDDVVYAVPSTLVPRVKRLGFRALATSSGVASEQTQQVFRDLASTDSPDRMALERLFAGSLVGENLGPTMQRIAEIEPDLVVSESLDFAGPLAAARARVPQISVGLGPLDLEDLSKTSLRSVLDDHRGRLGLEPAASEWPFDEMLATAFPAFLQRPGSELPAATVNFRYEDPQGPMSAAKPWGSGKRPSVYASLGTVASDHEELHDAFRAVLAGLGESDADVLFTIHELDPRVLGTVPSNVRLATHVPPSVAMACDIVLTHGGAGTTSAALSRGRPMVLVPLFGDQPQNARRVADLGAGVELSVPQVATDLRDAIAIVAGNPTYADTARELAAVMAAAPPAAAIVPAIHDLMRADRSAASA